MKDTAFGVSKNNIKKVMPMHGDTDANKLISFKQAPLKLVDAEKSHPSQADIINLRVKRLCLCLRHTCHALQCVLANKNNITNN